MVLPGDELPSTVRCSGACGLAPEMPISGGGSRTVTRRSDVRGTVASHVLRWRGIPGIADRAGARAPERRPRPPRLVQLPTRWLRAPTCRNGLVCYREVQPGSAPLTSRGPESHLSCAPGAWFKSGAEKHICLIRKKSLFKDSSKCQVPASWAGAQRRGGAVMESGTCGLRDTGGWQVQMPENQSVRVYVSTSD